jgi:hypothetical protein
VNLFETCIKVSGDKPKKKVKPSPAAMPIMLEVEVPPKPATSIVLHNEKNIIHIEDDTQGRLHFDAFF